MSVYLGNNKVGIALPANLTSTTVSATEERQVVLPDTYCTNCNISSNASARTAENFTNSATTFSPTFTATNNQQYRLIGDINITNSNAEVLETYSIDASFNWITTEQTIIENDTTACVSKITIKKNNNTSPMFRLYWQKTATYGFNINLRMYEVTDYNGLNQVIVEANPYTETFIKNWIERSNSFKSIEWPEGLTQIGSGAFYGCTYFSPTSLPNTITTIKEYAFNNCSNLSLTTLPDNLARIEQYAFKNSGIKLTTLPNTITFLGTSCFENCTKLLLTTFPTSLSTIPTNCFTGCTSITSMTIPNNVTDISSYSFQRCTGLASLILPNSITNIGSNAFLHCKSLSTVSCDGIIASLGNYAFNGASTFLMSLKSASFPNMTASSISYVFGNSTAANACQQLEFADVGSVKQISNYCFANCYKLQTLVLRRSDAICTLGSTNAFTNTPVNGYNSLTATIYVPSTLISTYQTATNWKTFYNNGTVAFAAIEGSEYEIT